MVAGNVKYVRGNCLAASISHQRILIHSCNCNGSWGGGIAYQLGVKYPQAESDYIEICERYGSRLLGKFVLLPSYTDSTLLIGCLFTASFGGPNQGSSESILNYTRRALEDMRVKLATEEKPSDEIDVFSGEYINKFKNKLRSAVSDYSLEMPQINSGIFGVPWPKTETLLKDQSTLSFSVYVI
ncbi:LANO_0B01772g1_1 [Lachancea nothofagi CBS 11611]|uniref:ADP-ribose 1''-phosphate phosphatase n=1 Tax=Lachancea nothofagi CBS 11611 TaxID=1266666 RepID=A0A1G4IVI2_9SACH|nr:LANO_0B01772g1_1 [Lachancea nothofagi CBS 11611]